VKDARNPNGTAARLTDMEHFTHGHGAGRPMTDLAEHGDLSDVYIFRLCDGCYEFVVIWRPPHSLCARCTGRQSRTKRRRTTDDMATLMQRVIVLERAVAALQGTPEKVVLELN
jgi:hypothetical protein